MTLKELLAAVDDKKLTKSQVEEYYDDLTHIYSKVCMELADLKKKEAFYFIDHKKETDVATKRAWRVTTEGQRLLDLEAYKTIIPKEIASLRNRIYSFL